MSARANTHCYGIVEGVTTFTLIIWFVRCKERLNETLPRCTYDGNFEPSHPYVILKTLAFDDGLPRPDNLLVLMAAHRP